MQGTILATGYTIIKKTKVIPNLMLLGGQIMSKETNTYTKLQINTMKTVKHGNGKSIPEKVGYSHLINMMPRENV